jgi:hypothetical protein
MTVHQADLPADIDTEIQDRYDSNTRCTKF